jgi:hypothetical protein
VQKPIQALRSFNGQGNTFDLNLKWARTLPLGIFHRILIEPRPLPFPQEEIKISMLIFIFFVEVGRLYKNSM